MRSWLGLVAAFAIYTLATIILFYDSSLLSGSVFFGTGNDPSLYIWMFQFFPDEIEHFQNLLTLKIAWAPVGLNITESTTTPLLAILAWPITAFAGPVVAFNIISMSSPALAATSCFAFARTYTKNWGAAFVSGAIFGFSTAVFSAMCGHLQTEFIAFVPLAFLFVALRAAGSISVKAFLFWLSVVIIAQFLVSLEIFVTEALFLFLFALVIESGRSDILSNLLRPRSDNLLLGMITVYAAVGLIVSPFIFSFLRGYAHLPNALQNGGQFPLDLTNFVLPTPVTWLGGMRAIAISRRYAGNWSEDFGYIGAPLVLISVFAAWRLRHDRRAWPLLAVLICGFIFTLGPRLHIFGRPSIWLPWTIMEKLPLLGNVLPGRIMIFVLLAISGLCALWAGNLQRFRWLALGAMIGAEACVLPASFNLPMWWRAPVPTAQLFTAGAYKSFIHEGDTVLFLPFGLTNGNPMFWQTQTKGYFRMINGYGNAVPGWLNAWPAIQMLQTNHPSPNFPQQFDLFARAAKIDEVIVPVSSLAVWACAFEQAGWHGQSVGNLAVFTKSPATQTQL